MKNLFIVFTVFVFLLIQLLSFNTNKAFTQESQLTKTEAITQANNRRSEAGELLKKVEQLLREARDEKSTIAIDCISDKLSLIKTLLNQIDKSIVELNLVSENDISLIMELFDKILVRCYKINDLYKVAMLCKDLTNPLDQ